MKKYFLTGLVILFPITLTLIIIIWLFNLFTEPFTGIVESVLFYYEKALGFDITKHQTLIFMMSRLIVVIFILVLLLLLGFVGNRFFFKPLMKAFNRFLLKIPFIRTIYSVSREITQEVLSDEKKFLWKPVLIHYPSAQSSAIGFVSGETPALLQEKLPKKALSVFVPTAPHPLSGFLLFVPEEDVRYLDFTTEEAFKLLLSCGAVHSLKKDTPPPSA